MCVRAHLWTEREHPKRYMHVLSTRTLFGKRVVVDVIDLIRRDHPGLFRQALNPMTVLIRDT